MANYNSDYTGAQIDSAVSRANSTDVTAGTVAASKAVVVDSNKDITGFRHITATGTVTAANVSLTGNVDLGDASGDTVTITGSIDSNLIPATDDTYDIGSSSYAWQDIYLEGDIYLSDATEIDVASGNLTIDVAGDIEINADGGDITFKDASSTLAAIDSSGDFNVAGSIETATIDYTDGDLAITIADGGGVTFAQTSSQVSGSTIGNVTIANGSITDSSGAISFGNENLTTTGSSTAGSFVTGTLTVDDGSITDSDGSISFGDENLTTTGIISFGTLTDSGESIAVTKFVDEGDGISSNDNDTTIPTSAAVKDYVDTKVTAEDLDLTTDSGTIAIDLDSETLTLTGGTGVDTSASSNTVTFALDLNELATETTIADADFIAMVDATDDGSGKITFENLEDAIFASVSGDITITEGGVATIQANAVALGTDTTGNYVATIADSGGGGITVANSGSESAAVTLELDIKGLTEDSIASGDFIAFSDEGESGDPANRETIDDVATLFAGTGLTASSAVIGVDANQTQIVQVGTLAVGAISSGFGAIDIGSSTANFGATTVDSLSASDGNITNVGDIALDSISADGTDINIAVSDNSATALTVKQGSDAYLIIDTANSSESVAIGTGISGTVLTLGHSTSETTVADNLSVDGNLTVSGNLLITGDSSEIKADDLVVDNATIAMGLTNGAAPSADSGFDLGIVPHWHTGSGAKTAFLGVDVSTSASAPKLTYIPDASFSSSIVSGTAGTIVANLEGNVTGTSGSTIGNLTLADGSITDSSGAISFGNENLSTSGTLGAGAITGTSFIIGSADIGEAELEILDGATVSTDELNLIDGGTARGTTAVASGDGILINDGGTMRMTNVDTVSTYFSSHNVGGGNIVTTGALASGSIASGFGTISTGNAITTTGVGTFASLDISGDVDVDGTLEADAITIDTKALDEFIADTVGAMVGSNTETGIAVTYEDGDNTLDFVLGATQTTLTSILNASLVAGRDADNQIKFSTDDEIIFRVAGGDGVTMKASGEIEATSLDISGAIDVAGTTNLDVVDIDGAVDMASTLTVGGALSINKNANGTQVPATFLNSEQSNDACQIKVGSSTSNKNSLVVGFETVGDDNSGNYGYLGINSVSGNAIKIDASNNVSFVGQVHLDSSADADLKISSGGSGDSQIGFWDGSTNKAYFVWDRSDDRMELNTALDFEVQTNLIVTGHVKIDTGGVADKGFDVMDGSAFACTLRDGAGSSAQVGILSLYTTGDNENVRLRGDTNDNFIMGQLGLNIKTPSAQLHVKSPSSRGTGTGIALERTGGSNLVCDLYETSGGQGELILRDVATTNVHLSANTATDSFILGDLGIGITPGDLRLNVSGNTAGEYLARFHNDGNNVNRYGINISAGEDSESGTNIYLAAQDGDGNNTGFLQSVGGTFALADTSDIRLKKNVKDTTIKGIETVDKIKIRDFDWKKNDNTVIGGFIANELKEVYPQAVDGEADGVWEDGSIKAMTVSRDVLVPLLIKAVQELSAKVEALENA